MLYWNVQSEFDGEATIQITYFTSGITWTRRLSVHRRRGREEHELRRASCGSSTTAAKNTRTPRCGWSSARSTWSRRSPSSRRFPSPKSPRLRSREAQRSRRSKPLIEFMERAAGKSQVGDRPADRRREGNHQGRTQRVLHLHDRRDRNDPERLVEADAVARRAGGAVQDSVPLSPAGIWRAARADVPADQRRGIEARHHAAAGRRRARVSRQRPRRPLVPDAAADQVHPDRRQDRAESRPRPGSDLRADQAPHVPRQTSGCRSTARTTSARSSATRCCRSKSTPSLVGWDEHEIYTQRIRNYTGKADRGRSPPHLRRAISSSAASSSRSCTTIRPCSFTPTRRRRQDGRPAVRDRSASKAATSSKTTSRWKPPRCKP